MADRIDRVERLTNLLALLLETSSPLSLTQIAGELTNQYPDNDNSRRTAFERDKTALRGIGVPIESETVAGGEFAGQTRYWIDRDRYELRDLELDDDERKALQVAMAATRPGSSTAQEALWKIGAGLAPTANAVAAVVPDNPHLAPIRDAVSSRQALAFRYHDTDRAVDPWGLLLREGFWYVVGFDHTRQDRRTFRLDRIQGDVDVVEGSTFERPDGFRASDAFPTDPKLIGVTDQSVEAQVLIDPPHAVGVALEVGDERVVEWRDDGAVVVSVPAGNETAFNSWLFGFLEHAEVLGPPEVRHRVIAALNEVAS